ncbi:MAG TPA: L-fucose:H+ symporter permease [Terracidiphilus sp.]|jgi:FHS family L-fucose permease-like MFS transporter|nr:L-fucose:H+ symporter permease [Terracidiphilus sp.]
MAVDSTENKSVLTREKQSRLVPHGMIVPFVLVTVLFFLWGVPNNFNDILIKQFMKSFELTRFRAGLVQSPFYLGYFLLATPAALLMRRFGYKCGIVTGLLLLASGAFLFWPAAHVYQYGYFLADLFIIGSGLSFLETASNPFIAQMGAPESAARRLNFAQAFNPLGAISGAFIGTQFILSGTELDQAHVDAMKAAHTYLPYLREETMRVVPPYIALGAVALFWAVLIGITRFPKVAGEHLHEGEAHGSFRELLGYPSFLFAVVAQFMYVGAQVGTWSYFIQYVQDSTHQHEKIAGYLLTGTLAAFGVGRFSSAVIMRYFRPDRLMALYSAANVGLVAVGVLFPGWIGLWAVFLTSFFMSVMFPTIFALGIDGLGRNTKIGGSLIVMAIVGGAVLTPLMGWISQSTHHISIAYAVPLVCYVVVGAYSMAWHKLRMRGDLPA